MHRPIARGFARAYATHWLPQSARTWLDGVEHAAFARALTDAMKKIPQLSGREESIAQSISARTSEILEAETVDGSFTRDAVETTHAKTAARACAVYECTRPYLGNDDATMDLIRTHAGAERTAQTMNGGLVRGALMLSRDPIATIASMVGNVTNDLAPGAWRREDGEFVTSTCTYREFFKKRDMEFLTATTCCSLDVDVWFSGLDAKSATVTLESSMARGDPECRISVRAGEK